MKKLTSLTAFAFLVTFSAQAQDCRGILERMFNTKPIMSCEDRHAMMGAGAAMMQNSQVPPQPAQFDFRMAPPPPPPAGPIVVMPLQGGAPTIFVPIR